MLKKLQLMVKENHKPVYIYDNSIDDADARLMFRMTNGQLFKQYTDDIPEWAKMLV